MFPMNQQVYEGSPFSVILQTLGFTLFQVPLKTSKTTIIYINFDLETYPTGSGPGSLELHESSFIQLNSTLLSPFKRRKNKKIAVSAIDLYQRNDGSLGRFDVKCMILK